MRGSWNSLRAVSRVARAATMVAVLCYAYGLVALLMSLPFAIPAFVTGTPAVVIAMFTGFRASHLREIAQSRDV